MINYIRKNNEKYKNNVVKNKFSKCFFLALKKIGCAPNFLRWSINWSLAPQDGNHLVVTKCFLVVPLAIQDWDHVVATKWSTCGKKKRLVVTRWSFTVQGQNDLMVIKWSLTI
jgi:hypothetical protein